MRIGPAAVAAVVIMTGCGAERPVAPPPEVATPWVAFQAEFRAVGGGTETHGRFFRRRDGSSRRETDGTDARPAFITIENRAALRFYSFSGGTWTAQPFAPGTSRPARASDFPGAASEPLAHDGLRVVRVITPTGAALLRAPDLDFFALVEQHPDPPLRIEYRVVSRDQPPAALFEPPAGVPVASLPWAYIGR